MKIPYLEGVGAATCSYGEVEKNERGQRNQRGGLARVTLGSALWLSSDTCERWCRWDGVLGRMEQTNGDEWSGGGSSLAWYYHQPCVLEAAFFFNPPGNITIAHSVVTLSDVHFHVKNVKCE